MFDNEILNILIIYKKYKLGMASTISGKWEFHQPFELCPEVDVWVGISRYLTDTYDLINFAKSSNYIKNFLFKILPSLYFAEISEHVVPYLALGDVRKCRQVCRHWNTILINYLEDMHTSVDTFLKPAWFRQLEPNLSITFLSFRQFARWERTMTPALTNPVVCRSVCLQPTNMQEIHAYFFQTYHHLTVWGQHIWNLRFSLKYLENQMCTRYSNEPPIIMSLRFIQACLTHVSNLRALNLESFPEHVKSQEKQVSKWLETHPFPRLENLSHFSVYSVSHLHTDSVWKGLVTAYQSHLKSLTVKTALCFQFMSNTNITLPQLAKLTLTLAYSEEILTVINLAKKSHWKLTELNVTFNLSNCEELCWPNFLQLIDHSKDSLEVLSAIVTPTHLSNSLNESSFDGVTLPKLKQFEITSCGLKSLQFLKTFSPNLKEMTVRDGMSGNFVVHNRRRKLRKMVQMYKANGIWECNPSLETIDIFWMQQDMHERVCHCTRKGYKWIRDIFQY